jgi:hypothetical protein
VNSEHTGVRSVTVEVRSPSPITRCDSVDYRLKLIKVAGETRWAVHNGRKVVGKLHESYGQAAAERTRVEQREALARPDGSAG